MKTLSEIYQHLKKDFEAKRVTLMQIALKQANFNQRKAAELLGIKRTTLLMFCKKNKIELKNPES